jgi:soluble lytic murein transglycosylase
MADSRFNIRITATDETAKARKQAEEGFNRLARPVTRVAEAAKGFAGKSGLGGLIDKFTGLSNAGRTAVGALGEASVATEGMGSAAGIAATGVGVFVAAAGAAALAAVKLASATADSGAEIGRTAVALGVSTRDLQAFRAAGAYAGVSADAMTESFHGLGVTLNDARWGRNAEALVMLNRLGMRLKYTKDGLIDTKAEMLDLADAISSHKNPQTQERIAAAFGVTGALPWLRQGRAGVEKDLTQALNAAGAATDAQISKDQEYQRKKVALDQRLTKLRRQVGQAVMPVASRVVDAGSAALQGHPKQAAATAAFPLLYLAPLATSAFHFFSQAGRDLASKNSQAAAGSVSRAATQAAQAASSVFDDFAAAIEQQESRGHQFRRPGVPLASDKGAIGVMQLLPETARETARRLGVAWDQNRFRNDANYNRMLGRAELQRLLQEFGGDQTLAAAAYNAGEDRLNGWTDRQNRHHKGWLERFGDPRKGQISDADFARLIPFRETRDYVANTAGAVKVDINLTGAPAGARTTVRSSGNVDVNVGHNALAGPAV